MTVPKEPGKLVLEYDRHHHIHPYTVFDNSTGEGRLLVGAGSGTRIYDDEGNGYVDTAGGMWCTNVGLGNKEMAQAIADQVQQLAYLSPFADMANAPAAKLAAKIAELAPGDMNHVFYTTGGSTAVDAAFRLMHFYQNCRDLRDKVHVISRVDAYHGSTYAAVSLGGKPGDHPSDFNFITDIIHHVKSPNFYRNGGDATEEEFADQLFADFEAKVEELGGASRVAAFIAEPIMAAGGVVPPPANYIRRIWEYCRTNDILYISDEVVTGWGRVGQWFASEALFGIQPDIIVTAKGLTSGYVPMGALLVSDRVWDVVSVAGKGRFFAVGFTYSAHPVGAAAALKNIEIIERENLLEHVREVGPYFMEQLGTLLDLAIVGDVRGSHLLACVELVTDKETKQAFPEEYDVGLRIYEIAHDMGLVVRAMGGMIVMSPALVISKEEIDFVVVSLRATINKISEEATAAGHI
jgi:adenosylmethionine-8-amino-7-oxononanoate aminotransferase|tara:strand:+ start:771 stop:2165 length:1395 start_codon:yes stop_codon:yes gene_type:complete